MIQVMLKYSVSCCFMHLALGSASFTTSFLTEYKAVFKDINDSWLRDEIIVIIVVVLQLCWDTFFENYW